jgi:HEAT repeat protein/cyclophilin family peptidyl-prolyl cis-trans isomerase
VIGGGARLRVAIIVVTACATFACATAPPAAPPAPAGPTFNQKMAWILRLEDQRLLRDAAPAPAPPPAPVPVRGKKPVAAPPPPPPPPDLVRLLSDGEARVRRRAALAVGRVGLRDGVPPLVTLLADPDPEVRQMAAFALGVIGDREARDPLIGALADGSALVQGSAAEALGLIGDASAAGAIGRMLGQLVQAGTLPARSPENEDATRDSPWSAFRLGVTALVRLKSYDQLAAAVLDGSGQPRVRSWPVAFALERLEDKRALPALIALAGDADAYTRAFAAKGLGALKDRSATAVLVPLLTSEDRGVAIEAIRAAGRIGDSAAAEPLLKIARGADPQLRVEAAAALGGVHAPGVLDAMLDLLSDKDPGMRAAALQSAAALDAEGFVAVLSALDPDPNWHVRAALASVLATLPADTVAPRLKLMLADADQRVVVPVLSAIARLALPDAPSILIEHLRADDPAVRAAAAAGLGQLKPATGAAPLEAAYQLGQRDSTYIGRAAALEALSRYGAAAATPVLQSALADKDWAVRVKAAMLLKELDPSSDVAARIRPAPTQVPPETYQLPGLITPDVSTQAFIDTDRGTIQIELAVLDAPLTVANFVTLATKVFYTGLTFHRVVPDFVVQGGDPRGDGEGGPGYTVRDEINERPYLRGTVGMALDWPDTGGSQFFIITSPQPHLDAKYTAFGRVIGGLDVVDRIQPDDVIRQIRIWDGQLMSGTPAPR